MKTIAIVDVSSYVHRAYHVFGNMKHLQGSRVRHTGTIHGLFMMLVKDFKGRTFDLVYFAYDSPNNKEVRRAIDPDYKANRGSHDDAVHDCRPEIKNLSLALGYVNAEAAGYEADDVMHTLVQRHPYDRILLFTGDKDLYALVAPNVRVFNRNEGRMVGAKYVREKWGVMPKQIPLFLALVGDKSDNIPNAHPKLGPATAKKYLATCNTAKELGSHPNIAPHVKRFKLNLKLVKLYDVKRLELKRRERNLGVCKSVCADLGLRAVAANLHRL